MLNLGHMIKNLAWSSNPLTLKLQLLHETTINKRIRKRNPYKIKFSLLDTYVDVSQLTNRRERTKKLSSFNYTWLKLIETIEIDIDSALEFKNSNNMQRAFDSFTQ